VKPNEQRLEKESTIVKKSVRIILVLTACLLIAGLAAFAVACGGDDTTATTAAPATTVTTAAAATETTAVAAPASGSLQVKGLVDTPKTLTMDDLKAMKQTTITAEHPKLGKQDYTGVLLSDISAAVGVQAAATILDMGATDGFMGEVTLADLDPNSMIAIAADGKLNVVLPGQEGKAWVKDVITLDFK
jgi:DMSO/TMAO reductase YedYZ molybdopterin-dependent catalytic subunit